jgi:hypothetical protein
LPGLDRDGPLSLVCVKAEAATLFAADDDFGLLKILDALLATPLEVCSFFAIPRLPDSVRKENAAIDSQSRVIVSFASAAFLLPFV